MIPVQWKKTAYFDLWTIIDYISDDNPEAAQELKDEVLAKIEKLSQNPQIYRAGRVPNTREIVVRKNFVIIYSKSPIQITILRILHAAQKYP